MRIGSLVRWQSIRERLNGGEYKLGIITHRAGGRVHILWLKDQSTGWYSDYYLEEVCE
jgi:hypothetical protein